MLDQLTLLDAGFLLLLLGLAGTHRVFAAVMLIYGLLFVYIEMTP